MIATGRYGDADASVERLGLGRVPMILMYHGVADVSRGSEPACA